MANLKSLKIRIASVKSTQKITKAMKMVAAAKLKRAQDQAEAARPYSDRMAKMLSTLAAGVGQSDSAPKLMAGTGRDLTHLLVVMTAHRGLCGAFNSAIVREAKKKIRELKANKRRVKILCIGKKGREQLMRDYREFIIPLPEALKDVAKNRPSYAEAEAVARHITKLFDDAEFDIATLFFNAFHSVISQVPAAKQVIPLSSEAEDNAQQAAATPYEFEPEEEALLAELLPKNLAVQIYHALLENAASEQGARMSAMDNATRNAGEMIKKLTLSYNRTRQATITKELIEIISGAEAL